MEQDLLATTIRRSTRGGSQLGCFVVGQPLGLLVALEPPTRPSRAELTPFDFERSGAREWRPTQRAVSKSSAAGDITS